MRKFPGNYPGITNYPLGSVTLPYNEMGNLGNSLVTFPIPPTIENYYCVFASLSVSLIRALLYT